MDACALSHPTTLSYTFIPPHPTPPSQAAKRVVDSIAAQRKPLGPSDQQILFTPNAGHYPFMDQPGAIQHFIGTKLAEFEMRHFAVEQERVTARAVRGRLMHC